MFNEYPYVNLQDINLDYILKRTKELINQVHELEETTHNYDDAIAEIKALYDRITAGDFPDEVKNAFYRWMRENAPEIVAEMIKNVFFGLTMTGYFVAYIPESWADLAFGTSGLDTDVPDVEYGRLILSY